MLQGIFNGINIPNIFVQTAISIIASSIKQLFKCLYKKFVLRKEAQEEIAQLSDENKMKIAKLVLERNYYLALDVTDFYDIRHFITDVNFANHDLQNVKLKSEYVYAILSSVHKCCLDGFMSQGQAKERLWHYRKVYSAIRKRRYALIARYHSVRNNITSTRNINGAWRELLHQS